MPKAAWSILGDRRACVQALNHLKLGLSPWRGLEYLSVGLDAQKRLIKRALVEAKRGETRALVINLPYGYGKTHLLRLARELADQSGFVVAHVTHDPLRNVAFNKPLNVYLEIVTDLCREYPHAGYLQVLEQIGPSHSYPQQKEFRSNLPLRLTELGMINAPPKRKGLLVLLDELEGLSVTSMPNRRSREISYEALSQLMSRQTGPSNCVVMMAITPGTLERFEADWRGRHDPYGIAHLLYDTHNSFPRSDLTFIPGSELTAANARTLHSRIDAVHAIARDRLPSENGILSAIADELIDQHQRDDGTIHYRTFVQACVTDFDIRFPGVASTEIRAEANSVAELTVPLSPVRDVPVTSAPETPASASIGMSPPPRVVTPGAAHPGSGVAISPVPEPVADALPPQTLLQPQRTPETTPMPSNPVPPWPQPVRVSVERTVMIPGAQVNYRLGLGIQAGCVILSVDWEQRTARVKLNRFSFETNVDIDKLSPKG